MFHLVNFILIMPVVLAPIWKSTTYRLVDSSTFWSVSTSLEDLLFSHVVSDHWTGQPKPALNAIGLQEVSVDEAVALPSTSAVLSQPEGSSDPSDDVQVVSTKQDNKSDDADAVEECVFSSAQTFALRWVQIYLDYSLKWHATNILMYTNVFIQWSVFS